ncbi:MAG: hypothetical protein IJK63_09540 [Oscillospiraceae bacterium]|nr:hypothetical protein [Oscillospiraceae bacterium]
MKPPIGRKYCRCPKCGYFGGRHRTCRVFNGRKIELRHKIRCSVCHLSTEGYWTPEEARDAWNKLAE